MLGSSPSPRYMEYSKWNRNVTAWRHRYKVKDRKPRADLTRSRVTCAKCKGYGYHRHHKGHEYLWAVIFPDTYAKRYVKFLKSDTVILCEECHQEVHCLYQILLDEALLEFPVTLQNAEYARKELVKLCNWWLKRG